MENLENAKEITEEFEKEYGKEKVRRVKLLQALKQKERDFDRRVTRGYTAKLQLSCCMNEIMKNLRKNI